MSKPRVALIILAGLLAGGAAASAQAGPNGSVQRGFSSQILIAQLSLYLPEEATQGMYRGMGGPGPAGASAGRAFPQIQFTRDPALFLTEEQIARLLPVLQSLRDSPLPTPSRAKQVQAEVDAQLTAGQKAEWAQFQKKMQAMFEEVRKRMAASGGTPGAMGDGGGQAGGPNTASDGRAGNDAPQMTLLERRQRQLDAFIAVLQARLKQ